MAEVWKDLPRSNLPYQISSKGRFRRKASVQWATRKGMKIQVKYAARILTVQFRPSGAPYVVISKGDKRVKLPLTSYMNELYGKHKVDFRKLYKDRDNS